MTRKTAPYGLWESPIEPSLLGAGGVTLNNIIVDKSTHAIYWSEGRPAEGGREVVVSADGKEITPAGSSSRTRKNGYGGGAATAGGGKVIMSDFATNGIIEVSPDGSHRTILPGSSVVFYGDLDVHPTQSNLVLALKQDETRPEPANVVDSLVLIDTSTSTVKTIAEGNDFYLAPRWSPDGSKIAWVEWSHPYSPWECSELFIADVKDGVLSNKRHVAGKMGEISITQPRWAVDGETLLFLSDESGHISLHAWSPAEGQRAVLAEPLNKGLGVTDEILGQATFASLTRTTVLICIAHFDLAIVDITSGSLQRLELPVRALFSYIKAVSDTLVVAICKPLDAPATVVSFNPQATMFSFKVLKSAGKRSSNSVYFSVPKEISFETGPDPGSDKKWTGHAWFYEPVNPDYQAPVGTKPPLIVNAHSGPTRYAQPELSTPFQIMTSVGFAICDVDYGGSIGFGNDYRRRLDGQWGVVDVDDCVAAAQHLIDQGLVDGNRVVIIGPSAGGYTCLQSVVRRPDFFAAGIANYGVGDTIALARETHKFEMGYIGRLVGGSPEEIPDVYRERSPAFNANKIKTPLLLLQGDQDVVVPVAQAREMQKAMQSVGTRCDLVIFKGEGHGFRRGDTLIEAAERSLAFLIDVLKLRE